MRPVSVCLPARSRSACVWITVLMRGCGCVRARARVCLGLASRTAQAVGHRDAPLCLSVCLSARARVQRLCIVYVIPCKPACHHVGRCHICE